MEFKECLVIFIDILGTRDNNSFESLYEINSLFRNLIKEQEMIDNYDINMHRIYKRTVFSFSDCCYIIYDYKDGIEEDKKDYIKLSWVALYNTNYMLERLISKGYFFRGGIKFGNIFYDKKENMIFGPAISEAYELESKYAKYPRVLIEENLAKEILSFHNSNNEKLKKDKEKKIKLGFPDNGEIIKQDENDKKYYLHYLNNIDIFNDPNNSFYNIANIIIKNMEKFYLESNFHILEKYLWLYKYIYNLEYSKKIKENIKSSIKEYEVFLLAAGLELCYNFEYYYLGEDMYSLDTKEYITKCEILHGWISSCEEFIINNNKVALTFNKKEYNFLKKNTNNIEEYIKNIILNKLK